MHLTSSVNWLGKYRRTWQIGKNKHDRARAQTQHKACSQSCKKPHFRLNWIQRDSEKTFFSKLMFYSCVRLGTPAEENDFLSPLSCRTWKCHHLFGFRGVFRGGCSWRVWWCSVICGALPSHDPGAQNKHKKRRDLLFLYLLQVICWTCWSGEPTLRGSTTASRSWRRSTARRLSK